MALFLVKLIHTILFLILNACVVYILYSGLADRFTRWTRVALVLMAGESIVLLFNDWRCPLTVFAENLGAVDGSVSDIFLPRWFADHLFDIYAPLFVAGCLILIFRRACLRGGAIPSDSDSP